MAISRKPKAAAKAAKEIDINELINKGGSVAKSENKKSEEKTLLLRLPSDVVERIDEIVRAKKIRTPRHTWLLEAVFEKLEREI